MHTHDGDITPGTNSYYGETETPEIVPPKKREWGSHGIRYDEECRSCHSVSDVDNDTELCERCGK